MSLNPTAKKTGVALLKSLPGLGSGVAVADVMAVAFLPLSNPAAKTFSWKALQAATALAGTGAFLVGIGLNGFHHPAQAIAAMTAGGVAHVAAGAGEFAPEKIQRPILRAISHAADLFKTPTGPMKQGFSWGSGRERN